MDTKDLQERLEKAAMNQARKTLLEAENHYKRTTGLSGGSRGIKIMLQVASGEEEKEFIIDSTKLLTAITKTLLQQREDLIKTKAIEDFLQKFGAFSDYIHMLGEG
jgi:hypothetical protein